MAIKEFGQGSGGASTFAELDDTPSSLSGQGGKLVKVKGDATGLEFASGGGGVSDFTDLGDAPSTYVGQASKTVKVKSDESGVEFVTVSSAAGDVVGPSSATDNNIATFDGETGELIQDGGVAISGLATSGHTHSNYSTTSHSHTVDGLSDASTSGVSDGDALVYNNSASEWQAGSVGDVSGPGSSSTNNLAAFSNTGGKTLADSGKAVADLADNAFKTIAVSGQTSVVADGPADTLTLASGANTSISTTQGPTR